MDSPFTEAILEYEGLDQDEILDIYAYDSIVPGACTQCLNVQYVEPDADDGCCEACGSNTVVSCLRKWGYV